MSDNKGNTINVGGGFFGMLTLLFIGLKLGGVINWSWWTVLAPLYAPPVIFLSLFLILAAIFGVKTTRR